MQFSVFFFFSLFPCYFFYTRCLQGFTLRIRNVTFYQFENSLESCSFDSTSLFLFLAYWLSFTLSLCLTLYSIEFSATAFMLTLRIRKVAHLVTSVNYLIKQLLGYFFCLYSQSCYSRLRHTFLSAPLLFPLRSLSLSSLALRIRRVVYYKHIFQRVFTDCENVQFAASLFK